MVRRSSYMIGVMGCLAAMPCMAGVDRFTSLLERNPFEPWKPPQISQAAPSPPYELRGVLVEEGVHYFSLYNVETKKSVWVRKDRPSEGLNPINYDETKGVLAFDFQGKPMQLALRDFRSSSPGPGQARASSTASVAERAGASPPAFVSAEQKRISQLEEKIQLRREQRAQQRPKVPG